MIREIIDELKKPRIYITILVGIIILYAEAYNILLGHLGLNDSDIAGNTAAQNYLRLTGHNIYNIIMCSYIIMQSLFPFFIVMPYIYKYNKENAKNYSNFIVIRMGYKRYYRRRIFIGGFLGGLTLVSIDILYFLFLSLFYNHRVIDFTNLPGGSFSYLFKSNPLAYLSFIWIEHFVLGFTFAIFAISLSMYIRHRPLIYIIPYACFLIYDILLSYDNKQLLHK